MSFYFTPRRPNVWLDACVDPNAHAKRIQSAVTFLELEKFIKQVVTALYAVRSAASFPRTRGTKPVLGDRIAVRCESVPNPTLVLERLAMLYPDDTSLSDMIRDMRRCVKKLANADITFWLHYRLDSNAITNDLLEWLSSDAALKDWGPIFGLTEDEWNHARLTVMAGQLEKFEDGNDDTFLVPSGVEEEGEEGEEVEEEKIGPGITVCRRKRKRDGDQQQQQRRKTHWAFVVPVQISFL